MVGAIDITHTVSPGTLSLNLPLRPLQVVPERDRRFCSTRRQRWKASARSAHGGAKESLPLDPFQARSEKLLLKVLVLEVEEDGEGKRNERTVCVTMMEARLVLVLALASLVAWTCNFLFTSLLQPPSKPFCDTNFHSSDYFPDVCEPCPSNGECNDGKLECLQGYQRHGNLCLEDGDISESARKIVERVEHHLCEGYAQFLCSGTGPIWVREDVLLNYFEPVGNVKVDNALHNYTKQRAVETMGQLLETRLNNSHGMKEFKCPDLWAVHYKPYSCRIRQWISQHILLVLPICAMLVGCTALFWSVRRKLSMSRRIEELYDKVCEILEENALTSKTANGECEPWFVASRLRDHLLLPRERKNPLLWRKVEELVQEDSRIDCYPKLVKGESKVVWEWQVEGSLSVSKMKRRRDASKTRVKESMDMNHQQHPEVKTEPVEPLF